MNRRTTRLVRSHHSGKPSQLLGHFAISPFIQAANPPLRLRRRRSDSSDGARRAYINVLPTILLK